MYIKQIVLPTFNDIQCTALPYLVYTVVHLAASRKLLIHISVLTVLRDIMSTCILSLINNASYLQTHQSVLFTTLKMSHVYCIQQTYHQRTTFTKDTSYLPQHSQKLQY
jgi:hypothetical protein